MDIDYLRKNGIVLVAGIAASLFCMLAYGLGWFKPLYVGVNFVLQPVAYWGRETVEGIRNVSETVSQISSLRAENAKMKAEVTQLQARLGVCAEVENENQILRSQLGIPLTENWKLVKARVLGVDVYGIAEYVIIDRGTDDGIKTGLPVILGDVLVGEVRETYNSISKIRLISNIGSNIYSIDQNTNAKGLVRGSLQGVVMEDILENEIINIGDTIISWEDEIPGNLVIGTVVRIEDVPTSSTKKAYIEPGYSLEDIQYVFIVMEDKK